MSQGSLTSFTTDRFGNANSALALNGGWTQAPSGIYFNTPEFTISVWIYPQLLGSVSNVINFGNGSPLDNIQLSIYQSRYSSPQFEIYNGSTSMITASASSSQRLAWCQWQLLTVTFSSISNMTIIYINGQATVSLNKNFNPLTQNRTKCYIGKSFYGTVQVYSSSYLDDLRFYNKSLSQCEILALMNNSSKLI